MASAPLSLARRMLFGRKASSVEQAGLDGALPPRKRPFRLLAIDGGGIRGILPAMVLADLERRTNRPIIDLFDMIVGTSTGGLLALALACPGEGGQQQRSNDGVFRTHERRQTIFLMHGQSDPLRYAQRKDGFCRDKGEIRE